MNVITLRYFTKLYSKSARQVFLVSAPPRSIGPKRHFNYLRPATSICYERRDNRFLYPCSQVNNSVAYFGLTTRLYEKEPLKPSSKVEETVNVLKEEIQEKEKKNATTAIDRTKAVTAVVKPPLWQRIKDEIAHYYHGFRLLFIDINVSRKLLWRVIRGKSLTRREYKLLVRTTSDVFRLVPFSVFIIVPFMEFLLPVFIKFFPNMLPSTFQTAVDKEAKVKAALKVKLEMAKFLQQTLDEMALQSKGHDSANAKKFVQFFHDVRTSGQQASNEDIIKFSKLFEDEITLDSLSRGQLVALCRVLEIQPIGTNNFLLFQLRMKLRDLRADDKMIQSEGIESLTVSELQQACRARGMRSHGFPRERLLSQLQQWLDLSLNEKVPPSLLLLSRALYLPAELPATDQLKATISALPESIATSTKAAIGEREGKVEYKTRIEVIREEEKKVKEERQQNRESEAEARKEKLKKEELIHAILHGSAPVEGVSISDIVLKEVPLTTVQHILVTALHRVAPPAPAPDVLVDTAEPIVDKAELLEVPSKKEKAADEGLSSQDAQEIEDALENIGSEKKKLLIEQEELSDLKAEMADYKEDIEDLHNVISKSDERVPIKESKAAQRLFKKVNAMIGQMDTVIRDLQVEEKQLQEVIGKDKALEHPDLITIKDLIYSLQRIQTVPDKSRLDRIAEVLEKIDDDRDGAVRVDDVMKVIELIGKDNVKLTQKQVSELVAMLDKEETLETTAKLDKVLGRHRNDGDQQTST